MDHLHEIAVRYFYIPLAAIAGSISALASAKTQQMTKADVILTFIAGFSFAIFVTPWLAVTVFGVSEENSKAIAGLTYVFGAGSNVLLPVLIEKLKRAVGNDNREGA